MCKFLFIFYSLRARLHAHMETANCCRENLLSKQIITALSLLFVENICLR